MKSVLFGGLLVLLIDQLTKFFVRDILAVGESVSVIPGIFSFTHVTNDGIGFGLLQGMVPFVVVASVLIILWLCYYYWHFPSHPVVQSSFALLLGGSIGNLIDRIVYGYVTDFLNFHVWPVFNVADAAVSGGGIVLLFWLSRK